MKYKHLIFIPTVLLTISACKALGPDYQTPEFNFSSLFQKEEAHQQLFPTTEIQQRWWEQFNDEALNELVSEAITHNYDIQAAAANLEAAMASRNAAQRDLFPRFNLEGDASKSRVSRQQPFNMGNVGSEFNSFSAQSAVSWELDIFGKLRRTVEAQDARIQAEAATKHGVMLSVIAEMAQSYFEVRGLQKRIEVTQHNTNLLHEVEKLANTQLKNGVGTQLEVSLARGERQRFEAQLPNLKAELKAGIYRISVLAGKAPEYYLDYLSAVKPLPNTPDIIPVGLRADILRNRPDIAIAERELAAENAEIGAAIANRYPDISLTGAVGTSAQVFSDLFTGGTNIFSIGSAITWEIFDGGYEVDQQKASTKAALANYRQTVLNALEEVESSLIRYGSEWQTLKALKAVEKTRQEGFKVAKLRYREGEEDFLSILDAERSLVTAEDEVIQSEIDMLTRLTTLYKALGGGWQIGGNAAAKATANEAPEKIKE